jgi:Cu/Ag efflux pump CusA
VIIGGLFSAAALTLVVLPALYVMFERRSDHRRSGDRVMCDRRSGDGR